MQVHRSRTSALGVCSWSLRAGAESELAAVVEAVGVSQVQMALDPLRRGAWSAERLVASLESVDATVRSGMMGTEGEDYSTLETIRRTGGLVPDQHWPANLAAARGNARVARELGLELVSLHAGFLPEKRGDALRARVLDRLRQVADVFGEQGVRLALETGQESAATLLDVLAELDHPGVGINFDPANMLLYGMGEPVAALRALLPHVLQVHVKDARSSQVPGDWGQEVPVGTGEVDWTAFFAVLAAAGFGGDLMIEREAGDDRPGDMRLAADLVRRHWPAARA
ncbi:sugar phosphate isomerase/epimerase family protein [Engelhardtia mirabilis]|uniref:L-ribulose-5-phosphate 3-epimerase UlaE n=1 Tax=Engelhardtia mirabilis TaxID=2528011 RepID=A0A518BLL0_9BACT|nr:L-ribulose-5-phosphate 3-epimerase UlaE [Planctomycetes bacterium Pla133]QDV02184.1 L-ribulose-5-phosphate 3-epimerase UlaE [Planctomycetes bacterium Pla86]